MENGNIPKGKNTPPEDGAIKNLLNGIASRFERAFRAQPKRSPNDFSWIETVGQTINLDQPGQLLLKNATFRNCIFEASMLQPKGVDFSWTRFIGCSFYLSGFSECDFSDTFWKDTEFRLSSASFDACRLTFSLQDTPTVRTENDGAFAHDPITSKNVDWCTVFDSDEWQYVEGRKKFMVSTKLGMSSGQEVEWLFFLSFDGTEWDGYKIAFLPKENWDFWDFTLSNQAFYSFPNLSWSTNAFRRNLLKRLLLAKEEIKDFSTPYRLNGFDVSELSEGEHVPIRPFRPASFWSGEFRKLVAKAFGNPDTGI